MYLRISVDPAGTSEAIARQSERCRAFCVARGWELVAEFVDRDESAWGPASRQRPGYSAAQKSASAGEFDVLVATKLDRVARRGADLAVLLEDLEKAGVSLACVDDPIDTSDASGKMVAQIIGAVAEMESANTSYRRLAANLQAAQSGKYTKGGIRAFGRRLDGEVVEDEAETIRGVARRILRGESLSAEARRLTELGVVTTRGNDFTYQTLGQLLREPHLRGIRVHRGVEYPGDFEPILDDLTALRTAAELNRRGRGSRPTTERRHLLTGFAECGLCGSKLQIAGSVKNPRDPTKPRLYRIGCKKSVGGCGRVSASARGFEREVGRRLVKHTYELLDGRKERLKRLREDPGGIEDLGAQMDAVTGRLLALEEDFYVNGAVSRDGYLRSRQTLLEESQRLASDIGSLQAQEEGSRVLEANSGESLVFDEIPIEARIELLRHVCTRVVLHPASHRGGSAFQAERVEIEWSNVT